MKREKIIQDLEGQKLTIEKARGERPIVTEANMSADFVDGYWYGRHVAIEDALRLLVDGRHP